MRRAPILRAGAATALALLAASSTGCIHNHYYGTPNGMPACAMGSAGTTTEVALTPYGAICEVVPSRVEGGTVVAQSPAPAPAQPASPQAVAQAPQSRILVSQPRLASRPWRRTDPEGGLATTKVEGGLDDTLSR